MHQQKHPKFDLEWQILCLCAQFGLDEKKVERLRGLISEKTNWDTLFSLAENHCVVQMLYRNLLLHASDLLPLTILESLRAQTHQYAIRASYQMHALLRLLSAFSDKEVKAVPLKGPILAMQLYGDLVWRDSVDLDIVVKPEKLSAARAVLDSLQYELQSELPAIQEDELVKYENALVYRSPHGSCSVDLHWQFTKLMEGFEISTWDFWQRLEPNHWAGIEVEALAADDLLILLTLHAAKDHCDRLKHFSDMAAFVKAFPTFDWERGFKIIKQFNLEHQLLLLLSVGGELWGLALHEIVNQRILADVLLSKISKIALNNLYCHDQPLVMSYNRFRFALATRPNSLAKIRYVTSFVFQPNPFDWAWVRLPAPLVFLYPLVHITRLVIRVSSKWIAR